MRQLIIEPSGDFSLITKWFIDNGIKRSLLVCGKSCLKQPLYSFLDNYCLDHQIDLFLFDDFQPNPRYESVIAGIKKYREKNCDSIVAIGGGSAIDVAKCIKLFTNMPGNGEDGSFLSRPIVENSIPFLVTPTTAGTGSEATHFAVIYYHGSKISVSDMSCLPDTIVLEPSLLNSLPDYHRKASMLDALCHAIESLWSVNSNDESMYYSKLALDTIVQNMDSYINNTDFGNAEMLRAAHLAGKAINITKTTAGHAMSYKLTSKYGLAHGHAAFICDYELLRWMPKHLELCVDNRGEKHLVNVLQLIASAFSCDSILQCSDKLLSIINVLGLSFPPIMQSDLHELVENVNLERLNNHPISLDKKTIFDLYQSMMFEGKGNAKST